MIELGRGRAADVFIAALKHIPEAVLCFAAALVPGIFSLRRFKKYAVKAGKKLANMYRQSHIIAMTCGTLITRAASSRWDYGVLSQDVAIGNAASEL
jgi:hypothetical protein